MRVPSLCPKPSCLVPPHFNSHLKWPDIHQGSNCPVPSDITCELEMKRHPCQKFWVCPKFIPTELVHSCTESSILQLWRTGFSHCTKMVLVKAHNDFSRPLSQIGASQIKAPTGSVFQKYVYSIFMVKMRIDSGSFGLFWFILGWG